MALAGFAGPWHGGLRHASDPGSRPRDPTKSTLSHHLKVLREAGVTRTRQEGTRCFVTLRRDSLDARLPGLLPALLSAAIAVLGG